MTPKFDGGRAFPSQPTYQTPHGAISMTSQDGMSLRDWFAGQIMAALIGSPAAQVSIDGEHIGGQQAATAYALADALIAQRSKP